MHILISSEGHKATLLAAASACSCTVGLVDHDAISSCGSHESGAVRVSGPGPVWVEGDIGQAIAECAKKQRHMSHKPAESVEFKSVPAKHSRSSNAH